MKSKKIIIDSTSRVSYSSYYVQGLYEVFGRRNVSFEKKNFKDLKRKNEAFSFEHYFAFILIENGKTTKFVVDFCDPPDISLNAYNWCDIYAKINFNPDYYDRNFSKLVIIPPSFGIKIWNFRDTVYHCLKNYLSTLFTNPKGMKSFFRDYYQQHKRAHLEIYTTRSISTKNKSEPYIFMIGTLWQETDNAEYVNENRIAFIKACKKLKTYNFEGGLNADENHTRYNELKEITFSKRLSLKEYITKTKLSDIVFNTPAVHGCHGWKLGEFLAMGKPIVSTRLSNSLPVDLVHGREIHYVSSIFELENCIQELINNEPYRQLLSKNANIYFNNYMTPKSVINQMLQAANKLE